MRLAGALIAAALLASAGHATAAADPVEARYSPAYKTCLASPDGQSTLGTIDCASAETTLQDAKLNATYKKVLAGLTAEQKPKLLAAERAWVAFRDAECASYEDDDWGTLSRINAADCVLRMTVQRTIDLENYPPAT